jgi:dihydroxyacid dehydratase/phosphogluconate dehydratase
VTDNPIILSSPRRKISGIDVLSGNFFESAVVKISGMSDAQLDEFDGKLSFVLYFENEDDANAELTDIGFLDRLKEHDEITAADLRAICRHNAGGEDGAPLAALGREELFDRLIADEVIKFSVVISGQGPEAYGMPEMFTPMQHINANRHLKKLAMIVTDGRYSGVSYGAAIGHVTPEAARGGEILYLRTGDILQSNLRARELRLVDREALRLRGEVAASKEDLPAARAELGAERLARIRERGRVIVPTNRLRDVTDAAHGVVPRAVAEAATETFAEFSTRNLALAGD